MRSQKEIKSGWVSVITAGAGVRYILRRPIAVTYKSHGPNRSKVLFGPGEVSEMEMMDVKSLYVTKALDVHFPYLLGNEHVFESEADAEAARLTEATRIVTDHRKKLEHAAELCGTEKGVGE